MKRYVFAGLLATVSMLAVGATAANAGTVVVSTIDGSQGWNTSPGENTNGGTVSITATPIDGNYSLAMTGDRSRFIYSGVTGSLGGTIGLYGNPNTPGALNNLGTVSQFTDLAFKYEIDPSSTNTLNPLYSPALRLVMWNGATKDELVYEAAYQPGGYASEGAIGTINSTDANSLFYRKNAGNENDAHTLAYWAANGYGAYTVGGFYTAVGSSAGSNYLAHIDDVTANGTTYNFELGRGAAAVPEPAAWAMMIFGFGGVGAMLRRRQLAVVA